jgi:hypothetical protein
VERVVKHLRTLPHWDLHRGSDHIFLLVRAVRCALVCAQETCQAHADAVADRCEWVGVQPDPCRAARPAILDKAIILSSSGAEISVAQFTDRGTHFEQRLLPICDPVGGNKTDARPCGSVGVLMSSPRLGSFRSPDRNAGIILSYKPPSHSYSPPVTCRRPLQLKKGSKRMPDPMACYNPNRDIVIPSVLDMPLQSSPLLSKNSNAHNHKRPIHVLFAYEQHEQRARRKNRRFDHDTYFSINQTLFEREVQRNLPHKLAAERPEDRAHLKRLQRVVRTAETLPG